jgi:predicted RNase H-like HicB family nuclease
MGKKAKRFGNRVVPSCRPRPILSDKVRFPSLLFYVLNKKLTTNRDGGNDLAIARKIIGLPRKRVKATMEVVFVARRFAMMQHFTLEYWIDDRSYVGRLRGIPGVFTQGETLEELEENIRDAYRMMLEEEVVAPSATIRTKEIEVQVRIVAISSNIWKKRAVVFSSTDKGTIFTSILEMLKKPQFRAIRKLKQFVPLDLQTIRNRLAVALSLTFSLPVDTN